MDGFVEENYEQEDVIPGQDRVVTGHQLPYDGGDLYPYFLHD